MDHIEVPAVDDERAAREGREAEARALYWARAPVGTPYGKPRDRAAELARNYNLDGSAKR